MQKPDREGGCSVNGRNPTVRDVQGGIYAMRTSQKLIPLMVLCLFCLAEAKAQVCPDPPPQTSGVHRFRHEGESFDIPITVTGCNAVALNLRWANGRNNGSNFAVT